MSWQPSASFDDLRRRAEIVSTIRDYFAKHFVLEVDVPVMASAAATDPHLDSISVQCGNEQKFLQTSPEFFMKRLLAECNEAVYYLGKAFRNAESGRHHNPEFTMLEWYRPGWDEHQLMGEVAELISMVLNLYCDVRDEAPLQSLNRPHKISYQKLFQSRYGINPHTASIDELKALAKKEFDIQWQDDDITVWLDVLFTHGIESALQPLTLVYDYPASQAALAKIEDDPNGIQVARRFEVFYKGMELANGYQELTDASVQRQRFEQDLQSRKQCNLFEPPLDENLLSAMQSGLPECAGVALGVDRLVMLALGASSIDEVLAFPADRA